MVFLLLNDQEELLASGDPKYAHLKEPLHLQVENDVDADFSSTITSFSAADKHQVWLMLMIIMSIMITTTMKMMILRALFRSQHLHLQQKPT